MNIIQHRRSNKGILSILIAVANRSHTNLKWGYIRAAAADRERPVKSNKKLMKVEHPPAMHREFDLHHHWVISL